LTGAAPRVQKAGMRRTAPKQPAKERILDAAVTLFARRGYEGTSFTDITELCGAKRSLILYHYTSKDELWRLAVGQVCRRFNDEMERRLEWDDAAADEDKMRAGMAAFIDTLIAVPEYGQIFLREGTSPGPRLDWMAQNFAAPVTLSIRFRDPNFSRRVKRSVLRDVITATCLGITALGPLLDVSLAAALHRPSAGVYPLTQKRRDEVIGLMMRLALD
jgi:AcrR family transcriptional regulator